MTAEVNRRPLVLVVDDEPMLRMMAVDMVEDAGFDAIEAADSGEAVRILEGRRDIDLVFTDVDMPPGISGVRLAIAIRDRWPPVHIIVTSGKPFLQRNELPVSAEFFSKPYRQTEIVSAMRRLVA